MIKYRYDTPLSAEERHKIHEAIEKRCSMGEITLESSICRTVSHLLEDKALLERYLTDMAGQLTKQRQQATYRSLITSIFHARRSLPCLNKEFVELLTGVVERERKIQSHIFIAENHLQGHLYNDVWKIYERRGDVLRLNSLDFSAIHCPSLRNEMKYYHRHLLERSGKSGTAQFHSQVVALNALTGVSPQIKYFADITETDAQSLILALTRTCGKKSGMPLSQNYIALAINSIKRIIDYLMSDFRDAEIKEPRPHINPFADFFFSNLKEYAIPTPAIPEDIALRLNNHSKELPPLYKLLYDIFMNTGLRLKEVLLLEEDCVEPSRYEGVSHLKFKPYKTIRARRRHGAGDYHRIMIQQALANEITRHIKDTAHERVDGKSIYIFLSHKPHSTSAMDSLPFLKSVRSLIKKHDIRDENGELWHFTSKQFRKTVAVTLIENGATTAELAYWLGHMSSSTAAKYYTEVRKMKLAELNTKFFKEKFDLILSGEQLEEYTEEERRLLYIDFRLEQRRVELGYCLIKAADGGCPNRNSLYNCVNCKNLCTGKQYLPYWNELLTGQQAILDELVRSYHASCVKDYVDFAEYKQELRLLMGYESIVSLIKERGDSL